MINLKFKLANKKDTKYYSFIFELSVALSIMALPLGWTWGEITGGSSELAVNLMMLLSVLCLFNFRSRFRLRINRIVLGFLLYQLVVLLYIIVTCSKNTLYEIIYNAYTVAIVLAVSSQDKNKEFRYLIKIFAFLGSIIVISTVIYSTHFFSDFAFTTRFSLSDSGDPLTLSDRILVALLAITMIEAKSYIAKITKYLLMLFALTGIIATGVRKTLLALMLILIVNMWYSWKKSSFTIDRGKIYKNLKKFILITLLLPTIYLFKKQLGVVVDQFSILVNKLIWGIKTFTGDESIIADPSAATRVLTRNYVINRWTSNDNILNFLFGYGYIEVYVDIPILQAFSDLGVFLGCIYVFYGIVYPAKLIFINRIKKDKNIYFFQLLAVPTFVSQLVNGVPYGYRLWLPIVYLIMFTKSNRMKEEKCYE